MNKLLEDEKRRYEAVPIPGELSERIDLEINKAREQSIRMERRRRRRLSIVRGLERAAAAAAAVILVFTLALNTNMAFAENAAGLPVVGVLARVLTFRSYETETEDMHISVEIPGIDMIAEDFSGLEGSINKEILELCEAYADEAVKRAEAYKEAFLATGGTEEEWEAHDIHIRVWCELKSRTEDHLSLAVMGMENWSNAYNRTRYYNIDLKDGKLLSLEDILGSDYKDIANSSIIRQMQERKLKGIVYYDDFPGVTETTRFYLNDAGDPVIVFPAYQIAPGSEGIQEFVITNKE